MNIQSNEKGYTNIEGLQISNSYFIDEAKKGKIGSFLRKSISIEEHEHKYYESIYAKTTINNEKRKEERKKTIKLSDLEFEKYVVLVIIKPHNDKVKCITYGKCIKTHQGVGS